MVPPCQAACPINTDVRGYVSALARDDVDEAIRIIRRVNPLPSVCGRICTRLCETACRRARVDAPVAIRTLKRYAADQAIYRTVVKPVPRSYNEKIAIIGSGPAGLTAAHDLALLGYFITIFEARAVLGGLLSEGIPKYRLPKEVVQREIDNIVSLGIHVKTGVFLGKDFKIEQLLKEYNAVFIAVGSQKGLRPQCKGDDLPGVWSGIEFLKSVDRSNAKYPGEKVLVIGGGHTALDAARTCVRLGIPDVTVVYRRSRAEIPAGQDEVEQAEMEGVKFVCCAAPVEFAGEGRVQRVRFVRMDLGEPDESGRRRPIPILNSEFDIAADAVILAIGYMPDVEELKQDGLKVDSKGTIIVRDATGITDVERVFAAGDVVTGPMSVVEAMASGRRAASAIHRYFRNMPGDLVDNRVSLRSLDESVAKQIQTIERQPMPRLPVSERKSNFAEVDRGYSREHAGREALRCLNCGAGASVGPSCAACLNCIRVCPFGIPVFGAQTAEIDISQCQACGICASECPASAIHIAVEDGEELRRETETVTQRAREEHPELAVIGYYCRYRDPIGPPFEYDGLYWLGRCCTGRLSESQILHPFEVGADGVAIGTCKGDGCRFKHGEYWITEHVRAVKKILSEIGVGAERLAVITTEEQMDGFLEHIRTLGTNPLWKGKRVGA